MIPELTARRSHTQRAAVFWKPKNLTASPFHYKAFGEKVLFKEFAESVETGRYKLNVSLTPVDGGKTKLWVRPTIEKYVQYPNSQSMKPVWKPQESNGVIERAVFKAMTARAESEGGKVQIALSEAMAKSIIEFAKLKGTWRGQMTQSGVGAFSTIFTLKEPEQGGSCGSFEEQVKDMKIGGALLYTGMQEEHHIIREKVEYGKGLDGAMIHLRKLDDRSIKVEGYHPKGKKICEGTLYLDGK